MIFLHCEHMLCVCYFHGLQFSLSLNPSAKGVNIKNGSSSSIRWYYNKQQQQQMIINMKYSIPKIKFFFWQTNEIKRK